MVAPTPRCTCTNGETKAIKQFQKYNANRNLDILKSEVGNGTLNERFDMEAMRERHEQNEKARIKHEEHVKYVYEREGKRHVRASRAVSE